MATIIRKETKTGATWTFTAPEMAPAPVKPSVAAMLAQAAAAGGDVDEDAILAQYQTAMAAYKLATSESGTKLAQISPIVAEMRALGDALDTLRAQRDAMLGEGYVWTGNGVVTRAEYDANIAKMNAEYAQQQAADLARAVEAEIEKRGLVAKTKGRSSTTKTESTTTPRATGSRSSDSWGLGDKRIKTADAVDFAQSDTGLNQDNLVIAITKASAGRVRYYIAASDGKMTCAVLVDGKYVPATKIVDDKPVREDGQPALNFNTIGDAVRGPVAMGGLDYTSGAHWGKDAQAQIFIGNGTPDVLVKMGLANAIKSEKSLFTNGNGLPQVEFLTAVDAWTNADV